MRPRGRCAASVGRPGRDVPLDAGAGDLLVRELADQMARDRTAPLEALGTGHPDDIVEQLGAGDLGMAREVVAARPPRPAAAHREGPSCAGRRRARTCARSRPPTPRRSGRGRDRRCRRRRSRGPAGVPGRAAACSRRPARSAGASAGSPRTSRAARSWISSENSFSASPGRIMARRSISSNSCAALRSASSSRCTRTSSGARSVHTGDAMPHTGTMSLVVPPYPPARYTNDEPEISAWLKRADQPPDYETSGSSTTTWPTSRPPTATTASTASTSPRPAAGPRPHFHRAMSEAFFVFPER